jgi:tetratricopeptide (TPR) repeat protein
MLPKAESLIPTPIRETLDWLIRVESYGVARGLAETVHRHLPPGDPEATDYLASIHYRCKDYPASRELALETLRLLPDSPEARFNAAKCLRSAGFPERAEALLHQALQTRPGWTEAELELAASVLAQGRRGEAAELLTGLRQKPSLTDGERDIIDFNLAHVDLMAGNFQQGLKGMAAGRRLGLVGRPGAGQPGPRLMPGADLRGKSVLICGEGGAGDEIIAARFCQVIRERGGTAVLCPSPALASLLSRARDASRVVTAQQARDERFDYWAPAMALPELLGLHAGELPRLPYLSAAPGAVAAWRARRAPAPGLHVGVRWAGNPLYENDLSRTVPFPLLEELARIPGVTLYSLQRDHGAEARPEGSPVLDWGRELVSWEETAAAIESLDLVISSCTSVPHLAGALGKPTWVLSPLLCYYVWAHPGDSSLWYPSVTLFRQTRLRDWTEPMGSVRARLEALAQDARCGS